MNFNIQVIEAKLNDFVRKFYLNRIVIGILLFVLFSMISFFSAFMIESVSYMTPFTKTALFYFLILISSSIFIFFVLIPLFKLLKIIPFLTHEEAASIISNHFPESKDLLINILQLNSGDNTELMVAAINQKIDQISPFNFVNAINFKKTFKFLFISLGILLLLITLGSVFNRNFSQGSQRFLDYSTYYMPENPYSIEILNDSLYCAYGDDFTLLLKTSGPSVLNDVFLSSEQFNVRMNSDSADCFSYTLRNVTSDIEFCFNYLGYTSDKHKLSIVHRPNILYSSVWITPPAYTGLDAVFSENLSDITAPYGSTIQWAFNTSHANSFNFYRDSIAQEVINQDEKLKVSTRALKPFDYHYTAIGDNGFNVSSPLFHVNLLPDYSPQIVAVSAVDSSAANGVFFSGHISDDYGFHSLTFNYFDSNNPGKITSDSLDLHPNISQDFYYYFDFSGLSKSVSYYFEVKDNDAVSGFKSAKTPISVYTTITNEEKQQRVDNLNSSIHDKIGEAQRLLRDLNSDLDDFQKNVSSNNSISDWEKQLKINNLLDKQNKLQSLLQDLSQENQAKNSFENQLTPEMTKELAEQQRLMQEMWDQLLTDDIKELLDKINEMANSLNEKNLRDNIQDLKFDFNQISEQLDRNNELMKMYNLDNKMQNLSKDLHQLSEEYKQLSNDLKSAGDNNSSKNKQKNQNNVADPKSKASESGEDFLEKMNDIKEQFVKKFEDYKNLKQQNSELGDQKLDMQDLEKQFGDVENSLKYQKNELQNIENIHENSSDSHQDIESADPKSNESSAQNQQDNSNETDFSREANDKNSNFDNKNASDKSDKFDKSNSNFDSDETKKSDFDNSSYLNSNDSDAQKSDFDKNNNGFEKGNNVQNNSEKNDKVGKNDDSSKKGSNNSPIKSDENNKQRRDNLSQQMQETAEEMEDLSQKMSGMGGKNKQAKKQENLNDIRQILDNLVTISFNQENLIERLRKNSQSSYLGTEVLRVQNSISKDFDLVQDSIYALAKREPKLGHSVYGKIDNIHTYFIKTFSSINENRRSETMNNQQNILTNLNDLSLLFSEIQDQMQNQDNQGQQQGEEQEENTSRNKKEMQQRQQSTQQMKSQQQSLKQNLQQMLQQLQQGEKLSSQKLAESLRQQEMMMQKLQEMQNGMGVSPEEQKIMNQIQRMMEQNKMDIVNRNIDQRLVDRQNMLFNKLLDLEKAEKSQEQEEKRESKQGFDIQNNDSDKLNLKLKDFGAKEYIHYSPLNLDLFYQNKYNDFIQNIE